MDQIEEMNPMPTTEHRQAATVDTSPHPVSRRGLNPPQHHTHVQHSCRRVHVDVAGVVGC